jgi:NADPH:quinone reductase-like Zn-dependent oxidoreductase
MKAIVRHEYGGPEVLKLEEIEKPTPRDDEVLVKVHAASANLGDWEILRADPFFIAVMGKIFGPKPRHSPAPTSDTAPPRRRRGLLPKYKVLGSDVAGRVEAVGKDVSQHKPGDEVFGMCFFGAFAEYVCVPKRAPLVPKPASMTFEEAAALPQATFIAQQGLCDKGHVQAGQKVLINGAGGGAGTLAVRIAKNLGAEVTAVDNAEKQEMMRSIGADRVIDYKREDFTQNGERYDLILDLAAHRSVFDCKRALRPGGKYVSAGGATVPVLQSMLLGPLMSMMGSKKVIFLMAQDRAEDLVLMTELVSAGKVVLIIDRRYPLSEVPEALQYMGEGHALGKVVITV